MRIAQPLSNLACALEDPSSLFIGDFKQGLLKGLLRCPEIIFAAPVMTRQCLKSATFTTTAMVFKTPFNSVFAIFYSLSRLIQFAYFVKCWRTLLKLKSCSDPLQQRNVKISIKRVRCMGKCRKLLLIASVLFTPLGEMLSLISSYPLSRQLYALGYRPEKRGYVIYSSRERGINHITSSLQADKRLVFTSVRIPQLTGVPNDGFLLTRLKTLIRLFRVLLGI